MGTQVAEKERKIEPLERDSPAMLWAKQKVWLIQRQFDIHRFKDYKIKSLMDNLQSDDRSDKRECEKQSPKRCWFFKYQNPDKDCSHSSNSRPYRICRTKRNRFGGFG